LAAAPLTSPQIGNGHPGLVAVGRTLGGAGKFALQPQYAPLFGGRGEHLIEEVAGTCGHRHRNTAIHPYCTSRHSMLSRGR